MCKLSFCREKRVYYKKAYLKKRGVGQHYPLILISYDTLYDTLSCIIQYMIISYLSSDTFISSADNFSTAELLVTL